MTEAEWLACQSTEMLLTQFDGQATERKFRLFACACYRRCGPLPRADERERAAAWRAVETAERYADGLADDEELLAAERVGAVGGCMASDVCFHHSLVRNSDGYFAAKSAAHNCDDEAEGGWSVAMARDIFGNPFRPVAFSPSWRTSTAVALASQMYESRDFGALPILADALQDAGCDSAEVLDHCRGPGPHVRGCWVVDLVLGKP
ncbi:Uncharacterized protein OS=Sorangium cellulosum (strain So ce56) GN=sce5710 PE=4 SV=1 [Gemmata massiliana]|uniref:SMI1/KNR4 family protein n=1 Tax=Gemmata massiliana TaxID=1210884 RepID=A0A6P2D965_9BACT|nr:hypothetical protein [Gemmata massiliana]VTR96030.1 Uncharacterized protein OS=Sorangium cellulosum (strain So ce56) GN=sce5710 PE=4 SV=1 [Gemmata massiliana]